MSKLDFSKILDRPTHHAYLVVGSIEENYEMLRLRIREHVTKKKIEASDVWSRKFENLNIDDAREIKEVQNTKPIGERRVVLFSLQTIQSEAQNSLLKLFEDPLSETISFVCATNIEMFLPTVLSRFNIVHTHRPESDEQDKTISKFLSGSIKTRLEIVESMVKEKDKVQAEKFLNALEQTLHEKSIQKTNTQVFEDIFAARRYLRSRAPSLKMILENLCGIVPVLK
jgi:DNA polymerase III delta prime subunit